MTTTIDRPFWALLWAHKMFGDIALDRSERARRFLEEAVELAHASSLDQGTVSAIADRVYSRPRGDVAREIGQAQLTLELLAKNIGLSADNEAAREFERVQCVPREEWTRRHDAKVVLGIAKW